MNTVIVALIAFTAIILIIKFIKKMIFKVISLAFLLFIVAYLLTNFGIIT